MGEFDKGGRVFEMMGDYYRLMKQYFIVDPKDMNTDEFWDNLIRNTEAFCLKHETDNDRLALELAMALITHAEDQARGKGTLCDNRSDHPAEAAFRMMLKFVKDSKLIPVSERLPEIKRDVLVSLKNGRFFVAALFPGSEGHEHWWIGEEEIHFAFNEVDGWMPLPEPYRTIARFEPTGKFHKCRCSACKTEFEEEMFYDNPVFKFCPNCAARMEVDR